MAFLTPGLGGTLFFRTNEVVLSLSSGSSQPLSEVESPRHRDSNNQQAVLVQLQFLEANPASQIVGIDQQAGKVNYLLGNDRTEWQTNIPAYSSILYKELYPGIDLQYDGALVN